MPAFLLTTEPGLEDLLADELCEVQPGADVRAEHTGHLRVEGAGPEELFSLRMVNHITEVTTEGEVGSLDEVRSFLAEAPLERLAAATSFRVSSLLVGEHDFERRELEGASGAVLQRRFGTAVDLENFEVNIRVDLFGRRIVVGAQLTRESLGKRVERGKPLRSSLKPTIAAAMLRLAGAHRESGRLIDPMCGAAVIPVEAASVNPDLEIDASDWDAETIEVARATLRNHGLAIDARVLDARSLGVVRAARFDYIVTEPPYGVRQARRVPLTSLYAALLGSFEHSLKPGGTLVVVVVKSRVFLAAVGRTGLEVADQRAVGTGQLRRRIFVLRR